MTASLHSRTYLLEPERTSPDEPAYPDTASGATCIQTRRAGEAGVETRNVGDEKRLGSVQEAFRPTTGDTSRTAVNPHTHKRFDSGVKELRNSIVSVKD